MRSLSRTFPHLKNQERHYCSYRQREIASNQNRLSPASISCFACNGRYQWFDNWSFRSQCVGPILSTAQWTATATMNKRRLSPLASDRHALLTFKWFSLPRQVSSTRNPCIPSAWAVHTPHSLHITIHDQSHSLHLGKTLLYISQICHVLCGDFEAISIHFSVIIQHSVTDRHQGIIAISVIIMQ